MFQRKVHRHNHQWPSAEEPDGSATRSIHVGRVILDASQRFPVGLHDARHHDRMESSRADVANGSLSGIMHTWLCRAQLKCR